MFCCCLICGLQLSGRHSFSLFSWLIFRIIMNFEDSYHKWDVIVNFFRLVSQKKRSHLIHDFTIFKGHHHTGEVSLLDRDCSVSVAMFPIKSLPSFRSSLLPITSQFHFVPTLLIFFGHVLLNCCLSLSLFYTLSLSMVCVFFLSSSSLVGPVLWWWFIRDGGGWRWGDVYGRWLEK